MNLTRSTSSLAQPSVTPNIREQLRQWEEIHDTDKIKNVRTKSVPGTAFNPEHLSDLEEDPDEDNDDSLEESVRDDELRSRVWLEDLNPGDLAELRCVQAVSCFN